MLTILGIVAIIMIGLCYMVTHIKVTVNHTYNYVNEGCIPLDPPVPPAVTPADPGYDEKGDAKEKENMYSIDQLLKVVNSVMLDEEEADER